MVCVNIIQTDIKTKKDIHTSWVRMAEETARTRAKFPLSEATSKGERPSASLTKGSAPGVWSGWVGRGEE